MRNCFGDFIGGLKTLAITTLNPNINNMSKLMTRDEYLQVVALSKLAKDKDREVQEMARTIGDIIGDEDMAMDHIYGYPNESVDTLLGALDIRVEDFKPLTDDRE